MVARLARIAGSAAVARGPARGGVEPPVEAAPARRTAAHGWVPEPPPSALRPRDVDLTDDATASRPNDDVGDDATAARQALAAAMASYTAAHGHPLGAEDALGPRHLRLAVRGRVAVAVVAALVLVVGVVAVRAWYGTQSTAVPLPTAVAPAAGGGPAEVAGASGGAAPDAVAGSVPGVVVHVVGEVASPGVVTLEPGARVADAVAAAGGATASADLTAINLARVLADGEQVVVPAPGQVVAGAPSFGTGAGGGGDGLVDLNQADAAAFDTLPGIGPVLAERIVSWRDEHGRFTAVEELTEVTGIGPALLAGVRDLVRVG